MDGKESKNETYVWVSTTSTLSVCSSCAVRAVIAAHLDRKAGAVLMLL